MQKEAVADYGFAAIVADGMGGLSGGDKVSAYVVSAMLDIIRESDRNIPKNILLSKAICQINGNVVASGIRGGSTAIAVLCTSKGVYWCTAGDSRIYLFRSGMLTPLNEDSDYMNDLIEQVISGDITFEEAESDSKKDSLAQYIGCKNGIFPDGNAKPLIPTNGDRILMCTDGVYNALSGAELLESMTKPADIAAADGIISQKTIINNDNQNVATNVFLTSAIVNHGNYGGPMINANGAVIGINTWGDIGNTPGGYAVMVDELIPLLNSNNIPYTLSNSQPVSETDDTETDPEPPKNGINIILIVIIIVMAVVLIAVVIALIVSKKKAPAAPQVSANMDPTTPVKAGQANGVITGMKGHFMYANAGNSRVYFFRNNKLIAQTKDHSVCQASVDMGLIRPEDIRGSEDRSRLLKVLGSEEKLNIKKYYKPMFK